MPDTLPDKACVLRDLEHVVAQTFGSYGYGEIRLPLAEQSALFQKSMGAGTDIIDKEMYHLHTDAARESSTPLSLRPEGTAGCLRAAIQNGLLREGARLWYQGEMFRHERPQKGRFRQFRQMGAEVIGFGGVETDAEILAMGSAIWRKLGIESRLHLEINCLGSLQTRMRYREDLVAFLRPRVSELDTESQKRLDSNPLRILDSKHQATQSVLNEAPSLADYWEVADAERFSELQKILESMNINYEVNHRLVRGLDYYGGVVFEWLLPDRDGAQDALAAGGRYDDLVTRLGGSAAPAAGFAIGMERLEGMVFSGDDDSSSSYGGSLEAYIVADPPALSVTLGAVEQLRRTVPDARICGPIIASEKAQLRRAKKSRANLVVSCELLTKGTIGWRVLQQSAGIPWESYDLDGVATLLHGAVKINANRRL
jgi:histidyl-tRNA synthetase